MHNWQNFISYSYATSMTFQILKLNGHIRDIFFNTVIEVLPCIARRKKVPFILLLFKLKVLTPLLSCDSQIR